jgi:AcrR family transcriptional regulator
MSPKLPKEYSDFRRKQILMSAWECFADRGYSETTVREIAKRMDASTGVIYNFFKGKEAILEAIQNWSIENSKQIFSRMGQKESVREAIREFFENNFECGPVEDVKKSSRGNISLLSEAVKKEKIRAMFNASYDFMEENLSRFFREGEKKKEIVSSVDPTVLAGYLIALLMGLQLQMALIDRLGNEAYIQNMKELIFSNVWNPPSLDEEKRGRNK